MLNTINIILEEKIKPFTKNFKKIPELCEYGETVQEAIKTKDYCEYWPLFSRYKQLSFLDKLGRKEADKFILAYALKRLIDFELKIKKTKLGFPYTLSIEFQMDEESLGQVPFIWPGIYFCRKRIYLGKYSKKHYSKTKRDSKYAKYIKLLLKQAEMNAYFSVFELQHKAANFDDHNIFVDLKESINSKKILAAKQGAV